MDLTYDDIQEIYHLNLQKIGELEKKIGRLLTDAIDITFLADGIVILFDVTETELEDELMMSVYSATCADVDALGFNSERFTINKKDLDYFPPETEFN